MKKMYIPLKIYIYIRYSSSKLQFYAIHYKYTIILTRTLHSSNVATSYNWVGKNDDKKIVLNRNF